MSQTFWTQEPTEPEEERRKRVLLILNALAETQAFSEIQDPSAWQREIRMDRPLPGRDSPELPETP